MLLVDLINIGNGRIEGLLGQLAGLCPVVPDLIEKDGVVQGQSQSNRVRCGQLLLCQLACLLVGFFGVVTGFGVLGACGEFGNVSVIVAFHLVVEYFCLGVRGFLD